MCFSVRGLRRVPWSCHGLVEDMEFGWMLRLAGERVAFDPNVSVRGAMLSGGGQAAANQRRRWEFGRKEIRAKYLPKLLRSSPLGPWKSMLSICDLSMPTMGTLAVACTAVAAIDLLCLFSPISGASPFVLPVVVASLALMILSLGLYALAPFVAMRLPWRYAVSVCAFPVFLLWKLRISKSGRPDRWVRTPRESLSEGATPVC